MPEPLFNHFTQGIALFFRQLLGVVQKFILKVRWQNNSSGIDRTGQTAATGPHRIPPLSNLYSNKVITYISLSLRHKDKSFEGNRTSKKN